MRGILYACAGGVLLWGLLGCDVSDRVKAFSEQCRIVCHEQGLTYAGWDRTGDRVNCRCGWDVGPEASYCPPCDCSK